MSEHHSLYYKLLGETARIDWQELQPFFAKGVVIAVEASLDLVQVAEAFVEDRKDIVSAWLDSGEVAMLDSARAERFVNEEPRLWAVVVAPWVLVQERAAD